MANPRPSNPIKPGESRNPYGRPKKGYSITEMMKKMLSKDPELKKQIGLKIADKAKKGDMAAMKMLWQYMDGMPMQNVQGEMKLINMDIDYVEIESETPSEAV